MLNVGGVAAWKAFASLHCTTLSVQMLCCEYHIVLIFAQRAQYQFRQARFVDVSQLPDAAAPTQPLCSCDVPPSWQQWHCPLATETLSLGNGRFFFSWQLRNCVMAAETLPLRNRDTVSWPQGHCVVATEASCSGNTETLCPGNSLAAETLRRGNRDILSW